MDNLWQMDPLLHADFFTKTDRQRRLCGCFLIRQMIWNLIPDEQLKKVVAAAEKFADGLLGRKEFFAITRVSRIPYRSLQTQLFQRDESIIPENYRVGHAFCAVDTLTAPKFSPTTLRVTGSQIWETIRWHLEATRKPREEMEAITAKAKEQFVTMPEELLGPANRPAAPAFWSRNILGLGRAMYEGETCHFALHDALEEEGQPELAGHFEQPLHPKGCWALDLILGKK